MRVVMDPGYVQIVPVDQPTLDAPKVDAEQAVKEALTRRPELPQAKLDLKNRGLNLEFAKNQVLPQLNLGAQFGLSSVAGTTPCQVSTFAATTSHNCSVPNAVGTPSLGNKLPFGGIYGDSLNRLWGFSFYNYAAVLTFQMPLDNAVPRAALAQARVLYEQQRMFYRAALSQAVIDVQSSLANLYADEKRAQATAQATYYARRSLHDEQVRFRVGMATTHDLLQFQQEEVSAEGNEVQADVDLENAKLALGHADGTLLQAFNINWEVLNPHEVPWYASF